MPQFDGTAETSVERLEMYLAQALANKNTRAVFGGGDSDLVPVEHAPPPGDSYDLVLGDLRLVAGLVTDLSNQVERLTPLCVPGWPRRASGTVTSRAG